MEDIGRKIKLFRNKLGYTQEEMAEKIGISFQSYSKIERNITDVNISRLIQIAEVLKIPIKELFVSSKPDLLEDNFEKIIAQKNEEIIKLQRTIITLIGKKK
jgi:transcriptional regulator with XRE-family HTH domain